MMIMLKAKSNSIVSKIKLLSEHKKDGADKAKAGPKIIQLQWLAHIKKCEARKNDHGDHFLNDF